MYALLMLNGSGQIRTQVRTFGPDVRTASDALWLSSPPTPYFQPMYVLYIYMYFARSALQDCAAASLKPQCILDIICSACRDGISMVPGLGNRLLGIS